MSPSSLRRFRAERVLRRDFEGLRSRVLATVRSRLGRGAIALDTSDLEACYAMAWQGLYASMLAGEQIANPSGWLVVVTLRRAIDECRARHDAERAAAGALEVRGEEPDIAARLDDMRRLRQLFEGLRERLDRRECEAATLCYLHGLSRAEAARRMGVSDRRMRKLMEGDGCGRRGVSAKVGELLGVIRAEGWCAERGSLMRALAFGVLDPAGERYRLALAHQRQCPACRRYVLSLRGLAAILPPLALPSSLVGAAGAGAGAGVGSGAGAGLGAGPPLAASIAGKLVAGVAAVGLAASGALIAVNEDAEIVRPAGIAALARASVDPRTGLLDGASSAEAGDATAYGRDGEPHPSGARGSFDRCGLACLARDQRTAAKPPDVAGRRDRVRDRTRAAARAAAAPRGKIAPASRGRWSRARRTRVGTSARRPSPEERCRRQIALGAQPERSSEVSALGSRRLAALRRRGSPRRRVLVRIAAATRAGRRASSSAARAGCRVVAGGR